MRNKFSIYLVIPLIVLTFLAPSNALVEWDVVKTLKIEKTPIDVAISLNGRWIFVLTDQGEILVYSATGKLNSTISVERSADDIEVGPREEILLLISREHRTIQVLVLDFVQNIDVSGSPFKGPVDAPVVIVVFSDFQ